MTPPFNTNVRLDLLRWRASVIHNGTLASPEKFSADEMRFVLQMLDKANRDRIVALNSVADFYNKEKR